MTLSVPMYEFKLHRLQKLHILLNCLSTLPSSSPLIPFPHLVSLSFIFVIVLVVNKLLLFIYIKQWQELLFSKIDSTFSMNLEM